MSAGTLARRVQSRKKGAGGGGGPIGNITFANLGASNVTAAAPDLRNGTDLLSYATASWTPPTDGLIICFVANANADPVGTVTLSGNSLTWDEIATVTFLVGSSGRRITMFAAVATGSVTGVTTMTCSVTSLCGYMLFAHALGVPLTGGAAGAFRNTNTASGASGFSGTVILPAAGHANNRPISCFLHAANEATTERTNWTEYDDVNAAGPTLGFETQVRTDAFETSASATWTTQTDWGGIAAELKAA